MRKIKIKVKHLVIFTVSVFLCIFIILPSGIYFTATSVEKKDIETAKVLYKRYLSLFPYGRFRDDALYRLAVTIVPENHHNDMIKITTAGTSSGASNITPQMIENSVEYYKLILKDYKDSKYFVNAYKNLMEIYTSTGRVEEGKDLIEQGLDSELSSVRVEASKYKMLYLASGRKYEEALKVGQNLIDEKNDDMEVQTLMGDMMYFMGKFDAARTHYEKSKSYHSSDYIKNQEDNFYLYQDSVTAYDKLEMINDAQNKYNGTADIHGKVNVKGKPVPFIIMYIKDGHSKLVNSIGDEERCIFSITDFNGEYRISNLPDGDYAVGISIPAYYMADTVYQAQKEWYITIRDGKSQELDFNFVSPFKMITPKGNIKPTDNKVDLHWERVEGASYYGVKLTVADNPEKMEGGFFTFAVNEEKITENKYTLDIDKLSNRQYGHSIDMEGRINPQAYLGIFYPGSRIPFTVEAYDEAGNLLSSTVPSKIDFKDMNYISIDKEGITKSDKLILEKKVEEAVLSYEEDIKRNPEDTHALLILSRIYMNGTREKIEEGKSASEGKDIKRAFELAKKYYDITGNITPVKDCLKPYELAYDEYEWALRAYKEIPQGKLDVSDYESIGDMNTFLGNVHEGMDNYYKVYDYYKESGYYNTKPIMLSLYMGDFEWAIKFADILNTESNITNKTLIINSIRAIRNKDKESVEYLKLKKAMELVLFSSRKGVYEKFKSDYVKIYKSVTDSDISNLLKEIGEHDYLLEQ